MLTRLKCKAPLDHGGVAGICYNNENISGHHFLRLQSSRRHLRTINGNRGFIREDGWYTGPSHT